MGGKTTRQHGAGMGGENRIEAGREGVKKLLGRELQVICRVKWLGALDAT